MEHLVQQWLNDAFGKDAPKMQTTAKLTRQQKFLLKNDLGAVWTRVKTLMSTAAPEERDAVMLSKKDSSARDQSCII